VRDPKGNPPQQQVGVLEEGRRRASKPPCATLLRFPNLTSPTARRDDRSRQQSRVRRWGKRPASGEGLRGHWHDRREGWPESTSERLRVADCPGAAFVTPAGPGPLRLERAADQPDASTCTAARLPGGDAPILVNKPKA